MDVASERGFVGRRAGWACAAVLLLMAANLLAVSLRKTVSNDEMILIPAGYYHLVEGNFQFNNDHPPLAKMWAALPLLLVQPEEPPPSELPREVGPRTWETQRRFWPDNAARHRLITFWPRAAMAALTVALGAAVFVYARRLFGPRAALLAVALMAVEPTVLAHGRIVQTDAPAALAYLVACATLHLYWARPTWRRAALVGLCLGAALTTKFSMLVLLPLSAAVFAAALWRARKEGGALTAHALRPLAAYAVALFVINLVYRFSRVPVDAGTEEWVRALTPWAAGEVLWAFRALSTLLPTSLLFGLYVQFVHNHYGHPASLLGQHSTHGWWYYFPAAFALKTTLPFLAVTLASLGWALLRLAGRARDPRPLWLLAPVAAYAAVSMASSLNIGVRHFLPVFPFLFIAGGALLDRLLSARRRRRAAVAGVAFAFAWMAFEAARAHPNYVPYMNQLASGRPHWWYLSDSNVEWGEDVGELCEYLRARGETEFRGAISNGLDSPRLYGVKYYEIFPRPGRVLPETRYVAVGASYLNGSTVSVNPAAVGRELTLEERVNYLGEYRARRPEAVFGGTIYLYRVKE